jgi:hypothetical protein
MANEYNIGGEMSEDKANELYMLLQQDTLPEISDDYELMQPSSTVSETDNAHSAIDAKIMENDLYDLVIQNQDKSTGAIRPTPNEVKSGLGLLELIGGVGAAYGAGKVARPLLSKLLKAIKRSPWKNVPQTTKTTGSSVLQKKLWDATGKIRETPSFTRTGSYVENLNKYGNVPGFPRMPNIPKPPATGMRKVGITGGKATKNDPMWDAFKLYDRYGEKIPPQRNLDFLLKK